MSYTTDTEVMKYNYAMRTRKKAFTGKWQVKKKYLYFLRILTRQMIRNDEWAIFNKHTKLTDGLNNSLPF